MVRMPELPTNVPPATWETTTTRQIPAQVVIWTSITRRQTPSMLLRASPQLVRIVTMKMPGLRQRLTTMPCIFRSTAASTKANGINAPIVIRPRAILLPSAARFVIPIHKQTMITMAYRAMSTQARHAYPVTLKAIDLFIYVCID